MGFKLKSGNKVDFKDMGSSPVRNMKDGDYSQSFEKSPMRKDDSSDEVGKEWKMPTLQPYKMPVMETGNSLIQAKKEENDAIKEVTDGKGVEKDASGDVVTTDDNKNTSGNKLTTTSDTYTPEGDLKEGDKKWHETDAFRNTGAGHIVDAVKSIRRGIKNIKAKKTKRVEEAKKAVESDTQTLKQQKLVDRVNKRQRKKDIRDIKKSEKDRIKLVKYNKRKKS